MSHSTSTEPLITQFQNLNLSQGSRPSTKLSQPTDVQPKFKKLHQLAKTYMNPDHPSFESSISREEEEETGSDDRSEQSHEKLQPIVSAHRTEYVPRPRQRRLSSRRTRLRKKSDRELELLSKISGRVQTGFELSATANSDSFKDYLEFQRDVLNKVGGTSIDEEADEDEDML